MGGGYSTRLFPKQRKEKNSTNNDDLVRKMVNLILPRYYTTEEPTADDFHVIRMVWQLAQSDGNEVSSKHVHWLDAFSDQFYNEFFGLVKDISPTLFDNLPHVIKLGPSFTKFLSIVFSNHLNTRWLHRTIESLATIHHKAHLHGIFCKNYVLNVLFFYL